MPRYIFPITFLILTLIVAEEKWNKPEISLILSVPNIFFFKYIFHLMKNNSKRNYSEDIILIQRNI